MAPSDYAAWLAGGAKGESMTQVGEKLFNQYGCDTCHKPDGSGRGPSLVGQYGHVQKLADGRSLLVDESFIRQAITNPNSMPLPGFTPVMPSFQGQLNEEQILELIAFVKSLGAQERTASMSAAAVDLPVESRVNYLNVNYGWRSWLFTVDHKRIALLYLVSITFMFFIGGAAAVLMRLHLLTPQGTLVQPETYNKLFTVHGLVMVFFFMIPYSGRARKFSGAHDDWRARPGVSALNLLSWYIYIVGAVFTLYSVITGGVDTGWTFYTPFSSTYSNSHVLSAVAIGVFITGFQLHPHRPEFHCHHSQDACARAYLVPHAAVSVVHVCHQHHLYSWHAGSGDHALLLVAASACSTSAFSIRAGRRPAAVPASLLVLFASRCLHHGAARDGSGQRNHRLLCAQTHLWLLLVAFSSLAIAILGFLVWGHHMFVAGQSVYASLIFSVLSFLVAIPSAIKVFNWTATLYKGSISYRGAHALRAGLHRTFHHGRSHRTFPRFACD